MLLSFIKMHGLGNDFIVIDGLLCTPEVQALQKKHLTAEFAQKICDRRFGIGADQILWIKPAASQAAHARMEVINADGSIAEMCGNGIRAVAIYLDGALSKESRKPVYSIETLSGILPVEITRDGGKTIARVQMGIPKLKPEAKIKLSGGQEIFYIDVDVGNPHAVIFVEDPWKYPVEVRGSEIEKHSQFPKRTNVEFAHAENKNRLVVRVWERGAGLTLACGTGACASAVAAIQGGKCQSPVEVKLPGGSLKIEWAGGNSPIFMSGPAIEVFRGEWEL